MDENSPKKPRKMEENRLEDPTKLPEENSTKLQELEMQMREVELRQKMLFNLKQKLQKKSQ